MEKKNKIGLVALLIGIVAFIGGAVAAFCLLKRKYDDCCCLCDEDDCDCCDCEDGDGECGYIEVADE